MKNLQSSKVFYVDESINGFIFQSQRIPKLISVILMGAAGFIQKLCFGEGGN